MILQLILSVGLAIIVSALCSLMEAALYAIPLSQVEVMKRSGRLSGRVLHQLKKEIHRPITAVLTLNTVANTMGAAIAGVAASSVFGEKHLTLFSIVFTLAILFFSEILPKTIGVASAKTVAPIIALPLQGLVILLSPLIFLARLVTRMVPSDTSSDGVSVEEIQAIAMLSRQAGSIDQQQESIIHNIVSLKTKNARQAMTPRTVVVNLSEHQTIAEALALRHQWDRHSRIPVYDKDPDDVVGIVFAKDILRLAADDMLAGQLSAIIKQVHFVPESAALDRILLEFFERHQHLFVVVDEYGSYTGIITLEDVIEEIVGLEILDESDRTTDMRALARQRRSLFAERILKASQETKEAAARDSASTGGGLAGEDQKMTTR
ncbi:MAG: hemolysin family protein [Thermodesulfobacteriota bacterium]